jgi:arginyl-tRNA--protein-N-Asp/Glu arginylyltransferase
VPDRIELLTAVSPVELDRYLREGWYRSGQRMITCRFISSDEGPRAVLWLRTRLAGYALSRSNRRLMKRNQRRYSVREGPLCFDDEHEALYQRYLEVAPGGRSATLTESLLGDPAEGREDQFVTREIAIRDELGQLVGFSAFDIGAESAQSVLGVYDPEHRRASLGYWSLLLEVEHAIGLGLQYHYAGYVMPRGGNMDYKLRVGQIEFLNQDDGRWRPWGERDNVEDPGQRLDRKLEEMQDGLHQRGVPSRAESYNWFEAPAWSNEKALLAAPRVLILGTESEGPLLLITWSFDTQCYALVLCQAVSVGMSSHDGEHDEAVMWLTQDSVTLSDDAEAAAAHVAEWWRSPVRIVRSPLH